MQLWLQVIFYSLLITGIFYLINPQTFSLKGTIKSFFPVTTKLSWYISAYFGLYMLIPILNTAIQHISKKTFDIMLLGLFIFSSILSSFLLQDPLVLDSGYSTLWLCILYITGAYIHKYKLTARIRKRTAFGLFFLMVLITFLWKMAFTLLGFDTYKNVLISYTSPTMILSGIFLFIAFSKLEFAPRFQKLIRTFAPATLGVLIIHMHPLVWEYLTKGFSITFVKYNCIVMVLLVLASSAAIYLVCTLLDLLRIKLFQVLKIKDLCSRFEHFFMSKFDSVDDTVRN